jgi:hypothetical protein
MYRKWDREHERHWIKEACATYMHTYVPTYVLIYLRHVLFSSYLRTIDGVIVSILGKKSEISIFSSLVKEEQVVFEHVFNLVGSHENKF